MWSEMLAALAAPKLVTVIGGGGKTGLMYHLVALEKDKGRKAVAAATTKLSAATRPQHSFLYISGVREGQRALVSVENLENLATLVQGPDENPAKMKGLPGEWLDHLAVAFPDTLFVVEGDGSAGKSLKGHLAFDPLIPSLSQVVIPVIGIDVIGAPLQSEYVHRPERVCRLAGQEINSPVTVQTVSRLLLHAEGYLRTCPPTSKIIPFLNKVETAAGWRQAQELAQEILTQAGGRIEKIAAGSLHAGKFRWYRRTDDDFRSNFSGR